MKITSFQGNYRFLSNFFPCSIQYEGLLYNSSEHAYQAAKTLDLAARLRVCALSTPGQAKREGRRLVMRQDWEAVKDAVMLQLVREKFTRSALLGSWLLETNDAALEEGNNWNDTYWGVCRGRGLNKLGNILMLVRAELKQAHPAKPDRGSPEAA